MSNGVEFSIEGFRKSVEGLFVFIPYFEELNLDIQDIKAGHIVDYVNYLSSDKGRKDNKIGGQSIRFLFVFFYDFNTFFDKLQVYRYDL